MNEHERLLAELLQEQKRTNQLLAILIEALADDDPDKDRQPQTYIDGTPVA